MTPDLVVLGNLLVDDVVHEDGRTRMGQPGGAILYASLAAALWGVRVGCVSLQGEDYPPAALEALRERGIFGGKDLSRSHPELGQSALYCVTEVHSQADVDRLAQALEEVTR